MTSHDPVIEADLHAYVDDQLDVARRIEVEAYLSENPSTAAKMMADLRVRDELRLALAGLPLAARQETREVARRLENALNGRSTLEFVRRAAAVLVLVGAGWAAHGWIAPGGVSEVVASVPPPQFVEEAIRAHQTAELRGSTPPKSAPRPRSFCPTCPRCGRSRMPRSFPRPMARVSSSKSSRRQASGYRSLPSARETLPCSRS
jgi:anti-sigma factor RsiW